MTTQQLKQAENAGCKTTKDLAIFEMGYLNAKYDALSKVVSDMKDDLKDYAAEEIESLKISDPLDDELAKQDNESVKLN